MNIFFTAAVRGGRSRQPEYAAIVAHLKNYGTVFSSHVSEDSLSEYGETNLTPGDIVSRELVALSSADIVFAETTTPSLGVGYLVARASALGKRVIALHYGVNTLTLSAMVKGDENVTVHSYKNDTDVANILKTVFGE